MWANFMKQATRGDRARWLSMPEGIVPVSVCRLSGRLPTEGCERAEVLDDEGVVTGRSMVYTDYFTRGTEPTGYCHLHPTRGLVGTIASWFTSDDAPQPPPKAAETITPTDAHVQATPLPAPGVPAAEVTPPPEPEQRRGFWSRVFGLGRDRNDQRDDRNDRDQERRAQPDSRNR
jgi:hypothetical protein